MFQRMAQKFAKKVEQGVKNVAEPIKNELKQTTDRKVDLYSKIVRLGVLILLFVEGTKSVSKDHQQRERPSNLPAPTQIVINNYMTKKEDDGR